MRHVKNMNDGKQIIEVNLKTIHKDMLENLLKQMEAELPDDKWAKSDFEYDKRELSKGERITPFFWVVRNSSTCLQRCDKSYFLERMMSQSYRFDVFRNNLAPISSTLYFSRSKDKSAKTFYFDGENLRRLSGEEEIVKIYNSIMSDIIAEKREQYPFEYAMRNEPLMLVSSSDKDAEALKSALEYADSIGDDSLRRCLNRLMSYRRCSCVHYILISEDYDKHCFYFSEKTNDATLLCGGIVFRDDRTENRWQIHT